MSQSVFPWQAFPASSNKQSSLFQKIVNYGEKSFLTLAPVVNLLTLFGINLLTLFCKLDMITTRRQILLTLKNGKA
jgi:hypothetical protein